MHLVVLAIMAVLLYLVLRSASTAIKVITQPKPTQLWVDPSQPMLKHCTECGEQIAKDAEICPMCKGRQLAN
jgi:hypothetical protein